jgi:hypothetical protein
MHTRQLVFVFVLGFCWIPTLSAGATSVHATRSCGHIHAGGERFRASVKRGKVSCHTARHVLRRFLSGHGKRHGDGTSATTYWQLGHWRCAHGTGGGGCFRHGHNYKTARDYIIAQL